MTYLLDTNVVSELRRPARMNTGVANWVAKVTAAELYLSVVTLFELERGIVLAERNQSDLGNALRWWMTNVILPNYLARALPVTASIALRAASFDPSQSHQVADHIVAATAAEHGLILVSRNVRHLRHPGVTLLNPFS